MSKYYERADKFWDKYAKQFGTLGSAGGIVPDSDGRRLFFLHQLDLRMATLSGARTMVDGAEFWSSTEKEQAWAKRFAKLYDICRLLLADDLPSETISRYIPLSGA